ncbi:MAG: undecaprenyl-diphosphate phosphatase, partial [Acidimicrobiales bacterium]
LQLVPWLLGWTELEGQPALQRTFDLALHMGTFVGALAYFWADIGRLFAAVVRSVRRRSVEGNEERLAWLIVVASLPAATIGFVLDQVLGGTSPEFVIGLMLILFGGVLFLADRAPAERAIDDFSLRDAVVMGFAQALALQPGVSRSGATISAGRYLRLDRVAATRISFLMSLPIIAGAGLYKGLDVVGSGGIPSGFGGAFLWGTVASAITGFGAVWVLLRLVQRRTFTPFVVYRVLAGAAVIVVAATGIR